MNDHRDDGSPGALVGEDGEPITSLEAAERLLRSLQDQVTDIGQQLADRNRTTADGRRLVGQEFWEWRSKAQKALAHKTKQLRAAKAYIQQAKTRERAEQTVAGQQREATARRLLWEAYPYLRRLNSSASSPELSSLLASIRELLGDKVEWRE